MGSVALTLALAAELAAAPAAERSATFVTRPTAVKEGDAVRITFAVDRETDVAVFVEDGRGKIVRHLAAGRLGANAPRPFASNSLEQTVTWDGKADYGQPAGAGPFRVRVALGVGAAFDKVIAADPYTIGGVNGLAVGPDGTVFVMMGCGGTGPVWTGQQMVAFSRDGTYKGMIQPFPATLLMDEVKGFKAVELSGRPAPVVHEIQARSFYPGRMGRKGGMTTTPDGKVLVPLEDGRIGALDSRGAAPWGPYAGPAIVEKLPRPQFNQRPFLCVSGDGRSAYVAGFAHRPGDAPATVHAAVYRVPLPARGPATLFFGKADEKGSDETHLGGAPRGLAVDGKGHLVIADTANDRLVVVNEADGAFVKAVTIDPEATAETPAAAGGARPPRQTTVGGLDSLAIDPATGALYVTLVSRLGRVELLKFAALGDAKPAARLSIPKSGNPDFPWVMALDAGAKPPVLWFGGDGAELLRVEDLGCSFGQPKRVNRNTIGNASFVDISVDRTRNEVYARISLGPYIWIRFNEETGELGRVTLDPVPSAAGSSMVPGPDGYLYAPAYPYHLLRFDRSGKPAPWGVGDKGYPAQMIDKEGKVAKVSQVVKHGVYVPVSMTFLTHTLGIRRDGHVFMFEPTHPGDRPPKALHEYLPTGERVTKDPIIWKVSDTAVGPKFDPEGNIYVAEQVKPADQPYPAEFASYVGPVKLNTTYLDDARGNIPSMYGSIVKFSPKGGMVHVGGENPFKGEPNLDPSLKTVEAASFTGGRLRPTRVTGAEWIKMGISHVDLIACNCENTRFDVDEFGRVWYPDLQRFRVGVLDTNGNEVTHFGGYGNADTTDALAFSWLIGVGVTDRYVYLGDSLNRRLLRARIVYAAEATCEVR